MSHVDPRKAKCDGRRLIIGVGNYYRSDDGIGIVVARRIQELRARLNVIEASGEGASLMDQWRAADHVILVDAVRSGVSPGRIHRLDARHDPIPSDFFHYSTHAFGVAEAVEMARVLDAVPDSLVIYGIEGKNFGAGTKLSLPVEGAFDRVVQRVLAECDDGPP